MSLLGPVPQSSTREPAKRLIVSSCPVTLYIRPLSAYQQELIGSKDEEREALRETWFGVVSVVGLTMIFG